jgi:CrcB protein
MTLLLVAIGAMVGAPARFLLDRTVQARHHGPLPLGTLAVNILGSGLLGGLAGASASHSMLALAGTGFCGALTTFSTFGYETARLAERELRAMAALNVGLSLIAGLAAAYGGFAVARWLGT